LQLAATFPDAAAGEATNGSMSSSGDGGIPQSLELHYYTNTARVESLFVTLSTLREALAMDVFSLTAAAAIASDDGSGRSSSSGGGGGGSEGRAVPGFEIIPNIVIDLTLHLRIASSAEHRDVCILNAQCPPAAGAADAAALYRRRAPCRSYDPPAGRVLAPTLVKGTEQGARSQELVRRNRCFNHAGVSMLVRHLCRPSFFFRKSKTKEKQNIIRK
jgi:hypothetical protein